MLFGFVWVCKIFIYMCIHSCSRYAVHVVQVYPDKAARREIGSLEVYCPHRSTGCTWTGPLSSVEEHAAHCPHKGVECSNPGCGLIMTAAMLDQHLEECSYREVKCHHCKMSLPFCQLAVSKVLQTTLASNEQTTTMLSVSSA